MDLDAKAAELFTPAAVPAWFTAAVHLGALCLAFESPGAFGAEVYAQELGFSEVPEELKLNLGEQLLRARTHVFLVGLHRGHLKCRREAVGASPLRSTSAWAGSCCGRAPPC